MGGYYSTDNIDEQVSDEKIIITKDERDVILDELAKLVIELDIPGHTILMQHFNEINEPKNIRDIPFLIDFIQNFLSQYGVKWFKNNNKMSNECFGHDFCNYANQNQTNWSALFSANADDCDIKKELDCLETHMTVNNLQNENKDDDYYVDELAKSEKKMKFVRLIQLSWKLRWHVQTRQNYYNECTQELIKEYKQNKYVFNSKDDFLCKTDNELDFVFYAAIDDCKTKLVFVENKGKYNIYVPSVSAENTFDIVKLLRQKIIGKGDLRLYGTVLDGKLQNNSSVYSFNEEIDGGFVSTIHVSTMSINAIIGITPATFYIDEENDILHEQLLIAFHLMATLVKDANSIITIPEHGDVLNYIKTQNYPKNKHVADFISEIKNGGIIAPNFNMIVYDYLHVCDVLKEF